MRRNTGIFSAALWTALCLAAGAAVPPDFSRERELTPPAGAEGRTIAAVTLDAAVYAASREDLGDLRVFRGGMAVPHLIERVTKTRQHTAHDPQAARRVSFRQEADNRIEVVFELAGDSPAADGLEVVTPLHDYERTARVSVSPDGRNWTLLVPQAPLFDYTRYMDIAQREIAFPVTVAARFVKLEILRADDAKTTPILELTREFRDGRAEGEIQKTVVETRPFRMDDVRFWRNRTIEEFKANVMREYPVAGFTVTRDPKEKTTIVSVDTRREPLTSLVFLTDSDNFCRDVEVQVPVPPNESDECGRPQRNGWRTIATATFDSLGSRTLSCKDMCRSADFDETRSAEYRLVIHDGDNPPLHATGVTACGNVYRAVFLAESATPHVLCYGAPSVPPPEYDAAEVLGRLRRDFQPAAWTAGPEKVNPAYKPAGGGCWRAFFAQKLVFGGIIALVVVALGWALVRAVRHAESA